ncbi:archease [Candidatus Woesearchaeota archaeon]|nr:archease [Candidatus Woesearchaeota archaeon]
MKQFEYLDHTADAKFRAFGRTNEEKLSNAVLAMNGIIVDIKKVQIRISKEVSVKSKTLRGLIYDFLDEALFLFDTEGLVVAKVEDLKITKDTDHYCATAILKGDSVKNYEVEGHVKAITYNDYELTDEYLQMVVDL